MGDMISKLWLILMVQQIVSQATPTTPTLSQTTLQQIFTQHKILIIYMSHNPNPTMQSQFQEYCITNNNCAIANNSSSLFENFVSFVAAEYEECFIIIDGLRKNKYIMPFVQGMTSIDLHLFMARFEQGIIQPYYASQKVEIQDYLLCRKVVGKDFNDFLNNIAPLKVLYLYTDQNKCSSCGQILRAYADFAQKVYDPKMIIFGYYHISKNDHPKLKDEPYPHILVFSGIDEPPYNIPFANLEKLEQKIIELATTRPSIKLKNTGSWRDRPVQPHPSDGNEEKDEVNVLEQL